MLLFFLQPSLVLQGQCTEVGSEENSQRLWLLFHSLGVFWLLLGHSYSAFLIPEALLFPGFHCSFSPSTVAASKAEGLEEFPAWGGDPAASERWQPPDPSLEASQACKRGAGGAGYWGAAPVPILLQMPSDYPEWQSPTQAQLGVMMTHQPGE